MAKGKISAELLQKIKDNVNIVEVIGEHVVLRKSGSNYSGLCPFHSERSPSFSVSEQKQVYHCYGCKRGGDLLSFVMEIHGMAFPDAVEELAERAKIALPTDWSGMVGDSDDPEVAKRRAAAREKLALAYKLNRFAAAYYHQMLGKQAHIHSYFAKRGVQGDWERAFYVGGAPPAWDHLASHLVAKKAPLDLAVELGLIRPSQKGAHPGGPGYFDIFRNRAMFPILDIRGRVAGFGGRALPIPKGAPDIGGESPKYMNSPDSLVFQKSKLAYGLYQAQKHIREKDDVILVEGYFDVVGLHAGGFPHAVAVCGTSLTPDHLNVFRRLGGRVTVLFDGDKAGVAAMERAMEIGLDQGMILYGASMPEGLDPDEVLFDQNTGQPLPDGQERMKAILGASRPLLDVRIDEAVVYAARGSEARTQALKRVAGWLARFKDPVGREVRIEEVVKRLEIPRSLLEQAMGAGEGSSRSAAPQARPAQQQPAREVRPTRGPQVQPLRPRPARTAPAKLSGRERVVLQALGSHGKFSQLFHEVRDKMPAGMTFCDLFEYGPAKEFTALVLSQPGGLEELLASPEKHLVGDIDTQVSSTLTEAVMAADPLVGESDVKAAIGRCLTRIWARFSQQIKRSLAEAEAKKDAGLQATLMKEYLDVQRKMKEFNSFYDEAQRDRSVLSED